MKKKKEISYDPIQIYYNGIHLAFTLGSASTTYPTAIGGLYSRLSLNPGAYVIKTNETTVFPASTWSFGGRPIKNNLFDKDTLCFKLYSSIGTFASSADFYISDWEASSSICRPTSPFSKFLANLNIAARKADDTLIPFLINTNKDKLLNLDALKGKVPLYVIEDIREHGINYGIITNLRLAYFLAQLKAENRFRAITEELQKYTKENLISTFKNCYKSLHGKPEPCFPTLEDAKSYVGNVEKIASRVYEFKSGNTKLGDGAKFIGRGAGQLTGREKYEGFSASIKDPEIMKNLDLVNTKYPVVSAAYYFKEKRLWPIVDQGGSEKHLRAQVKQLSLMYNGGDHGLENRIKYTKEFCKILGVVLS